MPSGPVRSSVVQRLFGRTWAQAALLFAGLVTVYHANFTVLDEGDAVPNILLPLAIVKHGRMTFSPVDFPEMFRWRTSPPFRFTTDFYFNTYRDRFLDKSTAEWIQSGHLKLHEPRYFIVESPTRQQYVSTFGPVPGITLLPLMTAIYALDDGITDKFTLRMSVAKLHASMLVAASAVFLFMTALAFTTKRRALLVAAAFGLGTCVFAISSQTLWQQTVNMFFLCGAMYFFVQKSAIFSGAALSGLFFGAAMACRPPSALFFIGALAFLAFRHRRSVLPFVLAATPVPLAVGVYNIRFFGSPFSFAQELVGHIIAKQKTGSPDLWQTPLLEGLAGLFVSPSRGLLIFSPFLVLSFWGLVRVFRVPAYAALRPLAIGAILTMLLQAKWFDWWGGWAYGYRPWLDAVPFLCLLLVPVLDTVLATRVRRTVFSLALTWAVFVQGLGALSYDRSWNLRKIYVVRLRTAAKPFGFLDDSEARAFAARPGATYIGLSYCDIDLPFCRHRLWSLSDNLISYQIKHFSEVRARRMPQGWRLLGGEDLGPLRIPWIFD